MVVVKPSTFSYLLLIPARKSVFFPPQWNVTGYYQPHSKQAPKPGVDAQHKKDLILLRRHLLFSIITFSFFFLEGGRIEREKRKRKKMNKAEWTGKWGGSGRS